MRQWWDNTKDIWLVVGVMAFAFGVSWLAFGR